MNLSDLKLYYKKHNPVFAAMFNKAENYEGFVKSCVNKGLLTTELMPEIQLMCECYLCSMIEFVSKENVYSYYISSFGERAFVPHSLSALYKMFFYVVKNTESNKLFKDFVYDLGFQYSLRELFNAYRKTRFTDPADHDFSVVEFSEDELREFYKTAKEVSKLAHNVRDKIISINNKKHTKDDEVR